MNSRLSIAMPFYYSAYEERSISSLPNVLVGFHPQPASVITVTVRNVMSCNRSHHLQHPSQGLHVHADARVQSAALSGLRWRECVFLVSFPKGSSNPGLKYKIRRPPLFYFQELYYGILEIHF